MNRRTLIGSMIAAPVLVVAGSALLAHDDQGTPEASPAAMSHGAADTGTGAAYLTITNTGDTDRMIAAASDAAQVVEIHDMVVENDVMSMVHLADGLEIPAGETVVLEPMSLHIMLIGLNESLHPDDTFDITLTFEQAGEVTVTATVATALPEEGETWTVGDLEVSGVWSRPAPKLSSDEEGTPDATPAH